MSKHWELVPTSIAAAVTHKFYTNWERSSHQAIAPFHFGFFHFNDSRHSGEASTWNSI